MAGVIYFGTQTNMQWVSAPMVGPDMSANKYTSGTVAHNGAFGEYESVAGPQTYNYDFGLQNAADVRHLVNTCANVYGSDIYFLDPFAMKTNILPIHWSAPSLAKYRTPNLMGKDKYKQAVTLTTSNTFNYPKFSAVMGADAGNSPWTSSESLTLWIPVPAGYTFHYGAHSNNTAANSVYVGITPDGGSEAAPTLLGNNTSVLTNYAYTPGSNSGVTLKLNGNPASTSYLSGLIAQILPAGTPAPTGNFHVGQGHSGCRISGGLRRLGHSAAIDRTQYSGLFKEFGNWAND